MTVTIRTAASFAAVLFRFPGVLSVPTSEKLGERIVRHFTHVPRQSHPRHLTRLVGLPHNGGTDDLL